MKRPLCVNVRGKDGTVYGFPFDGDPQYLAEWRANGLDIDEVCNTIPVWVVSLGLTWVWCRVQDAWQWLRVW